MYIYGHVTASQALQLIYCLINTNRLLHLWVNDPTYVSNPCIHLNKPAFTCACIVSLFLASMDALKCFSTIIAHFCAEPFSASFVIIFMQHEDKQDIIRWFEKFFYLSYLNCTGVHKNNKLIFCSLYCRLLEVKVFFNKNLFLKKYHSVN